jgi:hypothetical protein
MADPKEEKIEKRLEETGAPKQESELSDADFEKVSGGFLDCVTSCMKLLTIG